MILVESIYAKMPYIFGLGVITFIEKLFCSYSHGMTIITKGILKGSFGTQRVMNETL